MQDYGLPCGHSAGRLIKIYRTSAVLEYHNLSLGVQKSHHDAMALRQRVLQLLRIAAAADTAQHKVRRAGEGLEVGHGRQALPQARALSHQRVAHALRQRGHYVFCKDKNLIPSEGIEGIRWHPCLLLNTERPVSARQLAPGADVSCTALF